MRGSRSTDAVSSAEAMFSRRLSPRRARSLRFHSQPMPAVGRTLAYSFRTVEPSPRFEWRREESDDVNWPPDMCIASSSATNIGSMQQRDEGTKIPTISS